MDLFVEGGSIPPPAHRSYSDEPEQSVRVLLIACALQHGYLAGRRATKNVFRNILLLLTLRRLMSYIYGATILDVSRSHTTTQHSR